MYIYCLIFILLAVLATEYEFKTIPNADFVLSATAVLLILFTGFRSEAVSRDYKPYLDTFTAVLHAKDNYSYGLLPIFEPGFVLIVSACYKVFDSNQAVAVMVVFAALSISIKLFSFKKLSFNPFMALFLYYCHYFLIQEMTQVRNGMACSFFFLAIYYHLQGNRLKVIFFILLATLFHNSSILYLLLLFLKRDSLNVYLFVGLFIAAVILGLVKVPLLSFVLPNVDLSLVSNKLTTYADYADKGYYETVRFFNVLNTCNVIVTGYLLYYCVRYKVTDSRFIIFLKCNIISLFTYGLLIDVPSIATRVTELFGAAFPLLFVYGLKAFPFKKFNIIVLIVIGAMFFYIDLFYGKLLAPYEIIHFK